MVIPIWNIAQYSVPNLYTPVMVKDTKGNLRESFAVQYTNGTYGWCYDICMESISPMDKWLYKEEYNKFKNEIQI